METEASVAANVAGPSSRMIIQQCCSATLEVRPSAADTDAEFVQVFVCSFGITASDTQSWVILQNSWLPLVAVSLGLITLSIYLFFYYLIHSQLHKIHRVPVKRQSYRIQL